MIPSRWYPGATEGRRPLSRGEIMKTIERYVDEVSGREFKTPGEAEKSEVASLDIQETLEFVTISEVPNERRGDFANGEFNVQRTKEYYLMFKRALGELMLKHEEEITSSENLGRHGGPESWLVPGGIVGRFLDDRDSLLKTWYYTWSNICPTCYREWGQRYFTDRCQHVDVRSRRP